MIAETLGDLLHPDDCPAGVLTVRRGLVRHRGGVVDCVMAARTGPDFALTAVYREHEGGPWTFSCGSYGDDVLDALEPHTGTREYL
jgi:hypothetical protein